MQSMDSLTKANAHKLHTLDLHPSVPSGYCVHLCMFCAVASKEGGATVQAHAPCHTGNYEGAVMNHFILAEKAAPPCH